MSSTASDQLAYASCPTGPPFRADPLAVLVVPICCVCYGTPVSDAPVLPKGRHGRTPVAFGRHVLWECYVTLRAGPRMYNATLVRPLNWTVRYSCYVWRRGPPQPLGYASFACFSSGDALLKLCNAGGSRSLRPHVGAMVRLVRSGRVDHPFARAVYDNAMC